MGKVPCQMCDMTFKSTSGMLKHKLYTHKERKKETFQCYICQNVFTTNRAMKKHKETIHFKSNVTKCGYCDKVFQLKSLAKKHELAKHIDPDGLQKKFQCEICDFKSYERADLNYHRKQKHT